MLHVEIIDTVERLEEFRPQWDELIARSGNDSPFMTPEWFLAYWRSLRGGDDLLVTIVKEDGAVIALAPLMRTGVRLRGMWVRVLLLIAEYYSEWTELLLLRRENECLKALFGHLAERYPHDLVMLRSIIKGSKTDLALKSLVAEETGRHAEQGGVFAPFIPVTMPWDEYYKSRSKNVRHKLNRISNMFERAKDYEIVQHTAGPIEQVMGEVTAVDRKTWQYARGSSICSDTRKERFYTVLAEIMARRGWLSVWVLKLHGTPIAFQYALRYGNRLYGLKTGFDESYAKMAPGKFLIMNIIRYCHEKGLAEFNLMGVDESYKMELTAHRRAHVKYLIYGDTIKASLLYLLEKKAVPLAKQVLTGMRTREPETAK